MARKGKVFGKRWEVIESIDEGGQAYIYKVRDLSQDQGGHFVLKRLKNTSRLGRFKKEIETCVRLNHPGIAPIVDFSLSDPAFFVTKYYEGAPLSELGPFSPLVALDLFIEFCGIVEYAHSQGVIHRDLKPDNVLLTPAEDIVVLDFGLCYTEDDHQRLTATMEQVGSRFYMAPEFEGGRADLVTPKADVYALGKILHFMLSGRNIPREAFGGDNDLSRVLQNPQLGYVTERILAKSIVEDPAARLPVDALRKATLRVRRLIAEHYYPGREDSLCRFCGEGRYEKRALHAGVRISYPGIEKTERFEFVICNLCGNTQWFITER